MAVFKRGDVWWYKFYFAGRLIRESTKSTSKTIAKTATKSYGRPEMIFGSKNWLLGCGFCYLAKGNSAAMF